jgi:SRSO17 transposase
MRWLDLRWRARRRAILEVRCHVALPACPPSSSGRVENCQLGVFCAHVTPTGRALIDRELYLPKSWAADPGRCREAAVPQEVEFATKTELARQMLARALDAGVPAAWVTADEAYGKDGKFRSWLEARRIGYVVAVACTQAIGGSTGTSRADVLAGDAPQQAWKRGSCGKGAKGPPGYMTGRSLPCPPARMLPRPAGPAGCWYPLTDPQRQG